MKREKGNIDSSHVLHLTFHVGSLLRYEDTDFRSKLTFEVVEVMKKAVNVVPEDIGARLLR